MIRKPALSPEQFAAIDELVRLASIAVDQAQQESRRLGVPNVYSLNGRLYYKTVAGALLQSDPGIDRTVPSDGPESPTVPTTNG